jgi:hypothetical protein
LWAVVVAAIALPATAPSARANRRDFAFTYEWWTPAKGEKEIEVWNTYATHEKAYQGQVEFETGITDRLTVAAYALREKTSGESGVNGYKIETIYRMGDYKDGAVLPSAYLEYEKVKGETGELEGKILLSRYKADTNLSLNLIATRRTGSGAETETGYALGYARGTKNPKLRAGLEAIGSFRDRVHGLGPTVAYDLSPSTRAILSTNFALTSQADNQARLLVEYEFF